MQSRNAPPEMPSQRPASSSRQVSTAKPPPPPQDPGQGHRPKLRDNKVAPLDFKEQRLQATSIPPGAGASPVKGQPEKSLTSQLSASTSTSSAQSLAPPIVHATQNDCVQSTIAPPLVSPRNRKGPGNGGSVKKLQDPRPKDATSKPDATGGSRDITTPPNTSNTFFLTDAELLAFLDTLPPAMRGIPDQPREDRIQEEEISDRFAFLKSINQEDSSDQFDAVKYATSLYCQLTLESEYDDFLQRLTLAEGYWEKRKTATLVQEHSELFATKEYIRSLQSKLQHALIIASQSRDSLRGAIHRTSSSEKDFKRIQRQKRYVQNVNQTLEAVQALKLLEEDARNALQLGDIVKTHAFCKEFDSILAGESIRHPANPAILQKIAVLRPISESVAQTAAQALIEVTVCMRKLCQEFSNQRYSQILEVYKELGAESDVAHRLLSEFEGEVSDIAKRHNATIKSQPSGAASIVRQLMRTISDLVSLLLGYCGLLSYHEHHSDQVANVRLFQFSFLQTAVENALISMLTQHAQSLGKLKPLSLIELYVTLKRLDGFMFVLSMYPSKPYDEALNSYCESSVLSRKARDIAKVCFEYMHQQNLELVRVMLRNETWQRCKVVASDLQTIRTSLLSWTLSTEEQHWDQLKDVHVDDFCQGIKERKDVVCAFHLQDYLDLGSRTSSLFDQELWQSSADLCRRSSLEATASKHASTDKSASMNGLDQSFSDFKEEDESSIDDLEWAGSKTVTPTSLATMRWFSKYVQIGRAFPSLILQATESLGDLFLLYIFQVSELCNYRRPRFQFWAERTERYTSFLHGAGPPEKMLDHYLDPGQRVIMKQLRNRHMFLYQSRAAGGLIPPNSPSVDQVLQQPPLGLAEICTAVESMWTMAALVQPLVPLLHARMKAPGNHSQVISLFSSAIALTEPIRTGAYAMISRDIAGASITVQAIKSNKVYSDKDRLVSEVSIFAKDILLAVQQSLFDPKATQSMPPESLDILSYRVCAAVMDTVLEGYSQIDKCTREGRAQMLFDNQNLGQELSQVSGISPVPGLEKLDAYVRAHLLPLDEFIEWAAMDAKKSGFSLIQVLTIARNGIGSEMRPSSSSQLVITVKRAYETGNKDIPYRDLLEPAAAEEAIKRSSSKIATEEKGLSEENLQAHLALKAMASKKDLGETSLGSASGSPSPSSTSFASLPKSVAQSGEVPRTSLQSESSRQSSEVSPAVPSKLGNSMVPSPLLDAGPASIPPVVNQVGSSIEVVAWDVIGSPEIVHASLDLLPNGPSAESLERSGAIPKQETIPSAAVSTESNEPSVPARLLPRATSPVEVVSWDDMESPRGPVPPPPERSSSSELVSSANECKAPLDDLVPSSSPSNEEASAEDSSSVVPFASLRQTPAPEPKPGTASAEQAELGTPTMDDFVVPTELSSPELSRILSTLQPMSRTWSTRGSANESLHPPTTGLSVMMTAMDSLDRLQSLEILTREPPATSGNMFDTPDDAEEVLVPYQENREPLKPSAADSASALPVMWSLPPRVDGLNASEGTSDCESSPVHDMSLRDDQGSQLDCTEIPMLDAEAIEIVQESRRVEEMPPELECKVSDPVKRATGVTRLNFDAIQPVRDMKVSDIENTLHELEESTDPRGFGEDARDGWDTFGPGDGEWGQLVNTNISATDAERPASAEESVFPDEDHDDHTDNFVLDDGSTDLL